MSAELKALASNVDFWEAEDSEDIAESIEDVRGIMRWFGRSPGMESTELTEDDADRSASDDPGGLEMLPVPGLGVGSADSIMSGDWESGGGFEDEGNGAFAIRETGERLLEGEGLALEGADTGLCDEGDSSCR